jgi:hypothetical protein
MKKQAKLESKGLKASGPATNLLAGSASVVSLNKGD